MWSAKAQGRSPAMPMYRVHGEVPRKRHTQFWRDGRLLVEEVMGLAGFFGNETILYHLQTPCRISEALGYEPIHREEWVPESHVQRHL